MDRVPALQGYSPCVDTEIKKDGTQSDYSAESLSHRMRSLYYSFTFPDRTENSCSIGGDGSGTLVDRTRDQPRLSLLSNSPSFKLLLNSCLNEDSKIVKSTMHVSKSQGRTKQVQCFSMFHVVDVKREIFFHIASLGLSVLRQTPLLIRLFNKSPTPLDMLKLFHG